MGITYGDHLIDSGHHDITPEQEREIEAREECARRGLEPDDDAADGATVWMTVDQEMRERRASVALAAVEPAPGGADRAAKSPMRVALDALNAVAPAVENLACYQEQCDMDGCMVQVSRQALDETLAAVNEVAVTLALALAHPEQESAPASAPLTEDRRKL